MGLNIDELSTMDAVAQAELVRRRELTPLELVDAAIARIERANPTINAVITPLFEEARKAAVSPDLPDGAFRGVPFLLKDVGAMQKGQPYYMGNRALRDVGFRSPVDTPLVGPGFAPPGLSRSAKPISRNLVCRPPRSRSPLVRRAIRGHWIDRPVAPRAARVQPWQPEWFQLRMQVTAAIRSACRPHGVDWWG
jgi:hypothetical protein